MEVTEKKITKILDGTCMMFMVCCCDLAQIQTYTARVCTLPFPGKQHNLGVPRGHEDDTYLHVQNADAVAARLKLETLCCLVCCSFIQAKLFPIGLPVGSSLEP